MTPSWHLSCSACDETHDATGLPTVCPACGSPWLVTYTSFPDPSARDLLAARPPTMWRYREWLPLGDDEEPVSLGEGMTPLLRASSVEEYTGVATVWIKDESQNPTGSFKARGLSAAVTRAVAGGASAFTTPTAGNAGVALSAYAARAGKPAHVFAPRTTPPRLLEQVGVFGGTVIVGDGHIGDCGREARAFAEESGAFDVSTLREPYRIEGKKTLGLELAEQFAWDLPDAIVYPTGGGTGLIGMWKAFAELREAGWIPPDCAARLYSVQAAGCAPVVRAYDASAVRTEEWESPETIASGLRVPHPLGGALILRGVRETEGAAIVVTDEDLRDAARRLSVAEGIDACPEGGATVAALAELVRRKLIRPDERVVLFNTGAGWLYR